MKVKLSVREVLTYNSELTVILPDGMDEDSLDDVLDDMEREHVSCIDDMEFYLNRRGLKVVKCTTGFPESPDDEESEIEDYEILEDEDDEHV